MKYSWIIVVLILMNFSFCSENPATVPVELPSAIPADYKPPARSYWPTNGWQAVANDIPKNSFDELDKYLFSRTGDEKDRKGIRTDGFIFIHNGKIVYEKYARGFSQETPHLAWSVTKSFVNAFYGVAQKEGIVNKNDFAAQYNEPLAVEEKKAIRLSDLLEMSSGLFWDEGYESSPLKSSVIAMLYTSGREDMAGFAAAMPVEHKPGERFYYSSGTSNILMKILQVKLGEQYAKWPWEKIFNPLGMKNVTLEKDKSGNYVGSSYLYATPRDMAKFGFLYLNDGIWENRRILPEGWVRYSTTLAKSYYLTPTNKYLVKENTGAHWWLNQGIPERDQPKPWPAAPRDTFCATGHWGLYICIIPSYDAVTVRVGDDRDGSFSLNRVFKLAGDILGGIN